MLIVSSLKNGLELAKQALEENRAAEKLVELIKSVGDIEKLNQWKAKLEKEKFVTH